VAGCHDCSVLPRTVRALLPHTALRRSSPPVAALGSHWTQPTLRGSTSQRDSPLSAPPSRFDHEERPHRRWGPTSHRPHFRNRKQPSTWRRDREPARPRGVRDQAPHLSPVSRGWRAAARARLASRALARGRPHHVRSVQTGVADEVAKASPRPWRSTVSRRQGASPLVPPPPLPRSPASGSRAQPGRAGPTDAWPLAPGIPAERAGRRSPRGRRRGLAPALPVVLRGQHLCRRGAHPAGSPGRPGAHATAGEARPGTGLVAATGRPSTTPQARWGQPPRPAVSPCAL